MKKIILNILFLLLGSGVLISETIVADSTKNTKESIIQVDSLKSGKSGTNSDSTSNKGEGKRRMRDKFIDSDGDGINDNRCNGLGPNAGKGMGKRKRMGKK